MRSKRNYLVSLISLALALASLAQGQGAMRLGPHFWPTPNPAFLEHGEMQDVLQPTVSGDLSSALFGCVRNNGHRFHEGIDLRATLRDRHNESIDPVYAFDAGLVRHVNRRAGTSNYGNYIVIEHPQIAPGLITLYAHLRSIPSSIQSGVSVMGGQQIAIMGRSAGGYTIPRSRAHLHFEVGFWLGPDFQKWFDQQDYGSKNEHGAFNGMNIVGIDTWELVGALRSGEAADVWEFIRNEPVAVEAFAHETGFPDLLSVNPNLMRNVSLPEEHAGWRIELTWYGLPIRFEALSAAEMASQKGWLSVNVLRPDLLANTPCLDLVRGGAPGPKLTNLTRRLFVK